MKKSINSPGLEELLASVEHAGRDARRQQQLAEMIGQMAAQEGAAKRRIVRLWTVGIAAAACLLLFVSLIFGWHNDPLHPATGKKGESILVAENTRPAEQTISQITVAPTVHPSVTKRRVHAEERAVVVQFAPIAIAEDKIPDIETVPIVDYADNENFAEAIEKEPAIDGEGRHVTSFPKAEEFASAKEEPLQTEPQHVETRPVPAEPAKEPRHRSLFQILFTEPDLMEDNTLSFRLI